MSLVQMLVEAFESLISNKLRSGLTMLGIVIGVAAVISMLAVGAGAQASISSINSIGSNLIFVMANGNATNPQPLTTADAEAIAASVPGVSLVSAVLQGGSQVSISGQSTRTSLMAVGPDYAALRNLKVTEGNFITDTYMNERAAVVVLGPTVAERSSDAPPTWLGRWCAWAASHSAWWACWKARAAPVLATRITRS